MTTDDLPVGPVAVRVAILVLLVAACPQLHAQAHAQLPGGDVLIVTGAEVSLRTRESTRTVAAPQDLSRQLSRARERFFVGTSGSPMTGATYVVLVVQTPSTNTRATGYCGAGTEDTLYVLELRRSPLRLIPRDRLLLQSCVDSLSLADDTGTPLRTRLERSATAGCITLQWLGHPRFGDDAVSLRIESGKLHQGCALQPSTQRPPSKAPTKQGELAD